MKSFTSTYEEIISPENLLGAWEEFVRGKRGRADVLAYELDLAGNLLSLHGRLADMSYRHGPYEAFSISDPKPRRIHKATVEDRVLHRTLHRMLYPHCNRCFIYDSYSCRIGKGTHRALGRFAEMARRVSRNDTRTVWVLKCDVRKFFASIDQRRLMGMLDGFVADKRTVWLLEQVIGSFDSGIPGKGLPLGNLTSQLFGNIYLNEFDLFMKHRLKAMYYIRYADDFVIMSGNRVWLVSLLPRIEAMLREVLRLELHPDKVFLKTLASGVDFLGWVHFPDHRVLRTSTKRRMLKSFGRGVDQETHSSYMGLLKHGNERKLEWQLEQIA